MNTAWMNVGSAPVGQKSGRWSWRTGSPLALAWTMLCAPMGAACQTAPPAAPPAAPAPAPTPPALATAPEAPRELSLVEQLTSLCDSITARSDLEPGFFIEGTLNVGEAVTASTCRRIVQADAIDTSRGTLIVVTMRRRADGNFLGFPIHLSTSKASLLKVVEADGTLDEAIVSPVPFVVLFGKEDELGTMLANFTVDHDGLVLRRISLPSPADVAPVVVEATIERGRALFNQRGCNACHAIDGTRGLGPPFRRMPGKNRVAFGVSLSEPTRVLMAGYPPVMPAYRLEEHEVESLWLFQQSIR